MANETNNKALCLKNFDVNFIFYNRESNRVFDVQTSSSLKKNVLLTDAKKMTC